MRFSWLPWKFFLRRLARAHGFLDPILLRSRLQQFAQPSEVSEPLELVRAGVIFHARGLINTRVIQHNLDWVWPYWIEQQFNPASDAFVPRAFSITHINLTHRNWTAVGLPNIDALPVVDPRGLVTPFLDGWSIDAWVLGEQGPLLLPSRATQVMQTQQLVDETLQVRTLSSSSASRLQLAAQAHVVMLEGRARCNLNYELQCQQPAWLVLSIRPCNPEGVSLVHSLQADSSGQHWQINGDHCLQLSTRPDKVVTSDYMHGDVYQRLLTRPSSTRVNCRVGLATAAMLYRVDGSAAMPPVQAQIDLQYDPLSSSRLPAHITAPTWHTALAGHAQLQVPQPLFMKLYTAALQTLILHTPDTVYPGPYTYKRFWYRDATLIINALMLANLLERSESLLAGFLAGQRHNGYFHSQDGEWDSNGQVLWCFDKWCQLSGKTGDQKWQQAVTKAVRWIARKRLSDDLPQLHAGLLPAGFSAEHLGNNDYYYWDDYWSVAGLEAGARQLHNWGHKQAAAEAQQHAAALLRAISRSLKASRGIRDHNGIPASPYRRMDAGAIGSLAGSFPLQIVSATDPATLATVEFLLKYCFFAGAFFQDMIHSGLNAYLTLHVAQVLLRAGDRRFRPLLDTVANLASPTGHWPEAIHPRTLGGCMGDGQHAWAAAEWVVMMRNLFVREEGQTLVLGSGLVPQWLQPGSKLRFGPTPTTFGIIQVEVVVDAQKLTIRWQAQWRQRPTKIVIAMPQQPPQVVTRPDVQQLSWPYSQAEAP